MVLIISNQGYPKDDELLYRIDYFAMGIPCEGGILIVGKDAQGREYKPKINPDLKRHSYKTPRGSNYAIPIGSDPAKNHPALSFPFLVNCKLSSAEVVAKADANESFSDELDMRVMDEYEKQLELENGISNLFKFLVSYAILELADVTVAGGIRNHFWGELYIPKTDEIEKFLELHRSLF